MKAARPIVPARSPDASLGRETRGLVGPGRRGGGRGRARRTIGLGNPLRIVTPSRAAAVLGMLGAGLAFTFVTGPTAFGVTRVDVPRLVWTDAALVRQALALPAGTNVFQLDTEPLTAALRALPAVADAEISVLLPDAAIAVRVEERQPVLAWQVGPTRYIADREGRIFATVDGAAALPAGVALIDDRRGTTLTVGGRIDAVDLDVATRLGSVRPADVGSGAAALRVAVTNEDGFIVAVPDRWTAVFGFYSPATRSAEMIPGQVRLLRSLLLDREATVSRIVLASERSGTIVQQPSPRPTGQ